MNRHHEPPRKPRKKWSRYVIAAIVVGVIAWITWDVNTGPSHAEIEAERLESTKNAVESAPGLEGCKYIEVQYMKVIRCPASSTSVTYQAGKNHFERITAVSP